VHSFVEFYDGSYLGQLSVPDMKGPIAYALMYPERLPAVVEMLSFHKIGTLTFKKPETKRFPCLSYAYKALKTGGTMTSVLNAANEIAVNAFLKGSIRFTDIPEIIRKTMKYHKILPDTELAVVIEADRWARNKAEEIIQG
jgi:1-deoxy-D-xylulose-5-phosphate reductoisomerase